MNPTRKVRALGFAKEAVYAGYVSQQMTISRKLLGESTRPVKPYPVMANALLFTALRKATEDDPTAAAMLALHDYDHHGYIHDCQGCDFGGYEGDPPPWPCRTVLILADQFGVAR